MSITSFRTLFAISFVMLAAVFAYPGGSGKLDLTFAGVGYKYDGFPGGQDNARKTAMQPDGKILVTGYTSKHGSDFNVALTRYNPDGTPDTTFSGSGKVVTSFGSAISQGLSVAVQPNGKIVVAGYYAASGSNKDFLILRYNANGTLDTTFDGDGKVVTPVFSGADDQAFDVVIQPDGKIVAVGMGDTDAAVVRYYGNGSLDTTFDGDGIATIPFFSGLFFSTAIQADGKIVAAGISGGDFAVARYNTNGSLDAAFDGDGIVTTPIFNGYDVASSVALDAGGKIVAAGEAYNGSDYDFALVRYNTDGSLDTSFDGDGKLTATFQNGSESAHSVTIQPDGKIVAAGSSSQGVSVPDFAVLRLNADGSFDTSFDGDGKVVTGVLGNDAAYSVVIQPDGKLVACGDTYYSNWEFALVRYNTNGSLDTNFDGDGEVVADVGWGPSWGRDVIVQPDDKIVTLVNAGAYSFGLVRYNPDGMPDSSFGVGGKVYTIFFGYSYPSSLILQPDGKILAVGQSGTELNARIGLARYNTDGSLDLGFDGDGRVVTSVPGTSNGAAIMAAMQSDGKIVILGYATVYLTGQHYLVVARYNTDGSPDTSFDGDGILTTTAMNSLEGGHSIAVQPDGKIVVAGSIGGYHAESFALVRYNVDGSVDPTFGGGVVSTQMQPGGWSWVNSIVLLADGRIVAGGYSNNGANSDFALARFNSNGSLDASFGAGGKVLTPVLSGNDNLYQIAIQSDGKIMATGDTYNGTNTDMALVRYNADGSVDTGYGSGGKAVIDLGRNDSVYGVALDATNKAVVVGSGYDFITARITAEFAPLVDIGGRVTSTGGQGIGNAQIVLTDENNNKRFAITNPFGYYSFSGVSSNEIYNVRVSSKRYRFQPSSQTITLTVAVGNVDFVGNPGSESKSATVVDEKVAGRGRYHLR